MKNELSTSADLNETSLEQALIDISAFKDERDLKINAMARKLIIPAALQFVADRLLRKHQEESGTSDNDINATSQYGNDLRRLCSKSLSNRY